MNKLLEKIPVEDLYKDVLQPGLKKVGQALETVLNTANLILLPLKLVQGRARLVFDDNMRKYQHKLEKNSEEVIPVPDYVGLPILDKLTMLHDEYLSEAFINLLTKASFQGTLGLAHPAFLNILNSISSDEAKILKELKNSHHVSNIDVHLVCNSDEYIAKYKNDSSRSENFKELRRNINKTSIKWAWNLTGLEESISLAFPHFIDVYIENLERNGIIVFVRDLTYPQDMAEYEKLEHVVYKDKIDEIINETVKTLNEENPDKEFHCVVHYNYFEFTEFGRTFIKACIKDIE
jgi:hypothetical protein